MAGGSLTRWQLSILACLAERPRSGGDVIRELDKMCDDPPHRTTVYEHISALVDAGLVEVIEETRSGASNTYTATDAGVGRVTEYVSSLVVWVRAGEERRL